MSWVFWALVVMFVFQHAALWVALRNLDGVTNRLTDEIGRTQDVRLSILDQNPDNWRGPEDGKA